VFQRAAVCLIGQVLPELATKLGGIIDYHFGKARLISIFPLSR
jgi:hypothetical protein